MSEEVIRIEVGPEVHEFPVKRFDQITLADYIRIMDAPEGEQQYEMVSRVFGIPRRITLAMTTPERAGLLKWYGEWITNGDELQKRIAAVSTGLKELATKEKRNWTHKDMREALKAAGLHTTSIEVDGKTYHVPQRLDNTGLWDQWIKLQKAQEAHDKRKDMEQKLYATILAIFCMQEGETWPVQRNDETDNAFADRFADWYMPRLDLFSRAKYIDAQSVCAFFFSSSLEFEGITHPSLTRFPRSNQHSGARAATTSPPAGG